jgi:hypothetical protein
MTRHFACHARHVVVSCTFLLLCLLLTPARAELQVSDSEGLYSISLDVQMQVPARYVYRVLTDYAHIYRVDPAITDSEILPSPDDGVVRVRTRIADCITFFCKKIDLVQDVRDLGHGYLEATTVPTLGSFKSGHTEWKIMGIGGRTEVIYSAQMEPDFFIPPVIGKYLVKQKLRERVLASLARIQCLALIQAGLERDPGLDPVLVADGATHEHGVGVAHPLGQDSTTDVDAAAVGRTVRHYTDCARP